MANNNTQSLIWPKYRVLKWFAGQAVVITTALLVTLPLTNMASAQDSQNGAATQRATIEEIIVTARKIEESQQDIPLSIAVLDSGILQNIGAQNVQDLTNKLPNFLFQTSSLNSFSNLSVRGVGVSVRNAGFNAGVSFYIDGVYQGRPLNFNQDLVDIDRVELALGPQGTLYGRNTIGGVVNIVTRNPTPDLSGWAEVETGDRNDRIVRGAINIPLIDDRLYARLSGGYVKRDGYEKNIFLGVDQGEVDRSSVRLKLLGMFDRTEVLFSLDYQSGDERAARPEYVEFGLSSRGNIENDFPIAPEDYVFAQDTLSTQDFDRKGASLHVTHSLANGLIFNSVTGYKDSSSDELLDGDLSYSPLLKSVVFNNEEQKLFSQEFRLSSSQEQKLRWVIGAYYLRDEVKNDRGFNLMPPFVGIGPLGALNFIVSGLGSMNTDAIAGFANLDFDITDKLILEAGVRYTYEKQKSNYEQIEFLGALGTNSTAFAQSLLGPTRTGLLVGNAGPDVETRNDDAVTPTLTANYHFDNSRMIYARYSRGFKSGGFNQEPLTDPVPQSRAFGPEKLDNYEIGLKSEWLEHRLLFNLSAFHQSYRDLQRIDLIPLEPAGFTRSIRNAGKVRVKGLEVEVRAIPLPGLELRGVFGYADAKFKEFMLNDGTDLSGQSLSGVPKWNASFGVRYTHRLNRAGSVFLDLSDDIRAKRLLGEDDSTSVSVNGYSVVDGRLGFESSGGSWEFSLWARNLFDERYVTERANGNGAFYPTADNVAFGLPRAYGITLRHNFGGK